MQITDISFVLYLLGLTLRDQLPLSAVLPHPLFKWGNCSYMKEQEEFVVALCAPCGSSQLSSANYMFAPRGGKVLIH